MGALDINSIRKEFRAFKEVEHYQSDTLHLLPFNYHRLKDDRELIVSITGDYIVADTGTVHKIVHERSNLEEGLLQDLIAGHFVSYNPPAEQIEILANRLRTKKGVYELKPALHIIVLTLRCDHTCSYCQVSRVTENKTDYDLSKDQLDRIIDKILTSAESSLTVEFQGGESLLAFDKLQYVVQTILEKAHNYSKHVKFVACTNLSIVNKSQIEFLKEHNIAISSSLDGPDFIHNSIRHIKSKDSHQRLLNSLDLIDEIWSRDYVDVLMTTSRLSLQHPIDIVDEYIKLGFRSIFLRPISPYGFALRVESINYGAEDFFKFYQVGLEYILEKCKQGVELKEQYACIVLKKILTPFQDNYVDLMSPSGSMSRVIVYDYDGKIYASDESRMLAQNKDFTFQLGDINQSWEEIFQSEKSLNLLSNSITELHAACSNCALEPYCGSDPVHHHATQFDMYGNMNESTFCKRSKFIIEYLINLIEKGDENSEILRSWIQ
jgi:His-Xaa-Ser system radical SAM maturase HxsB